MNQNGLGDKYAPKAPIEEGLTEREQFNSDDELRANTGEATQRPKATDKTVSSDRGAFNEKC